MSHIIGIGSIRPFGTDMVYVQVSELVNETIFNLERCLRGVVQKNPWAEWRHFMEPLTRDGFELIQPPQEHPIFIHSRPWDEHLVGYGQSFFVAFPENAPYELAGRLVLASPPEFDTKMPILRFWRSRFHVNQRFTHTLAEIM